jgi:hypothetical protein
LALDEIERMSDVIRKHLIFEASLGW